MSLRIGSLKADVVNIGCMSATTRYSRYVGYVSVQILDTYDEFKYVSNDEGKYGAYCVYAVDDDDE